MRGRRALAEPGMGMGDGQRGIYEMACDGMAWCVYIVDATERYMTTSTVGVGRAADVVSDKGCLVKRLFIKLNWFSTLFMSTFRAQVEDYYLCFLVAYSSMCQSWWHGIPSNRCSYGNDT